MMPPPGMGPHKWGGRAYKDGGTVLKQRKDGGAVKDGPTWKEGLRDGTPVQHLPGKLDTKDIGRKRVVTFKAGGAVGQPRTVKFLASGGKVEAPQGVDKATKLPGGSGGLAVAGSGGLQKPGFGAVLGAPIRKPSSGVPLGPTMSLTSVAR